jgi:hypothetical protein
MHEFALKSKKILHLLHLELTNPQVALAIGQQVPHKNASLPASV